MAAKSKLPVKGCYFSDWGCRGKGWGEIHLSVIFGFEIVSLLRFFNDRVGKTQCLGEYKCTVAPVLAQL